jgi:hypothetical protein
MPPKVVDLLPELLDLVQVFPVEKSPGVNEEAGRLAVN